MSKSNKHTHASDALDAAGNPVAPGAVAPVVPVAADVAGYIAVPQELVDAVFAQLPGAAIAIGDQSTMDAIRGSIADTITPEAVATQNALVSNLLKGANLSPADHAAAVAKMDALQARTQAWATQHAATRVVQVAEATQRGIAQVVAEGIWSTARPQVTNQGIRAKLILDSGDIGPLAGLDAQRVSRVLKFEDALLESDHAPDVAARMSDRFAKRMLDERVQTIKVTETADAKAAVERSTYESAGMTEHCWLVGFDEERDCEECKANEDQGWIPIDEPFQSGHLHPTAHPHCACSEDARGGDVMAMFE